MRELFLNVLNISLTAAYCAAAVLCIRLFLQRLPKLYSYFLWIVVFVRFAVPVSLEGVYSFVAINSRAVPTDIGMERTARIATGLGRLDESANRIVSMAFRQPDAAAGANSLQIVLDAAAWIWLIAAAGMLCYGIISYYLLKLRLRDAVHTEGEIYAADKIPVPFVMGILRPRIYIPCGLTDQEWECIVRHEQVHLKRRDYLIKQAAFLIVCVHWFNPMAWISLWFLCHDMELSCDEQVLNECGPDEKDRTAWKKAYAAALLTVASGRRIRLSGPLFFNGGGVKGRIKNVLGFKRPGNIVTCVSIVLVILAAVGLLGSRRQDTLQPAEVDSILQEAGYSYVYRVPEQYWAGIEGLPAGDKPYPIILATDLVYDNMDGNMASIDANVFCLTEEGLQRTGLVFGGGTAYPIRFDMTGIYSEAGHEGNRCMINTRTWELEIAERVEAVYDEEEEHYYYMENDETRDCDIEEFLAFFEEHKDAVVMDFEGLEYEHYRF